MVEKSLMLRIRDFYKKNAMKPNTLVALEECVKLKIRIA